VIFEAEVKVTASSNNEVAFLSISRIGQIVTLAPQKISIVSKMEPIRGLGGSYLQAAVDLTRYRTVRLHHHRGWMRVEVDGEVLLNRSVYREEAPATDHHGVNPERRTQFGQVGISGESRWRRVSYQVKNPTLKNYHWSWVASEGHWPDQYQRERLIQVHANHPAQKPDHGYSSWLTLKDGRIFLVDYTNYRDVLGTSHLVGVYLTPNDLT
jgi:hypothetical protein